MFLILFLSFISFISCSDLSFKDCDSAGNEFFKIDSIQVKPYPVKYPGNLSISSKFEIFKDIPAEDLKFSVSVDKLTPTRMHIPCLNGFGSCVIDYCDEYKKKTNILLNQFALGACPVKAGKFEQNHPGDPLPAFGSIFEKVMEGDFESNATYFNSKTNQIYGCIQMKFTVVL